MNKINLRVFAVTLLSVLLLNVADVFAGTGYTHGRAFLKQGSPAAGGKVYVASNATEPTSGQYKAVTSTTSPAFDVKLASDATFHYWAVANPGYIFTGWYTYEGTLVSSGAAHISKTLTQPQAGGSDSHSYADYYASFIKQIQMSFVEPTNGSFTITHNGAAVTPAYSSFTTEGKVVLTALPADGYKLRGWYTTTNGGATKNYFAFGSTCEPNFTSNVTIGAEFVPDNGKATFWIKGTNNIYDDLGAANTAAASSSSKMIVVVSDGLVVPGTYTISSGVTLLIPCNELYENMTTPKVMHYTSSTAAPALSAFRKLTLSPGATINVSGKICIAGQQTAVNGGNPTSQPCGPVGVLDMSRGGTINLNNGSILYAWGFVKGQDMDQGNNTTASGVGEINANAYSTVWEDFQCGEWRGGTASSTIYDKKSSWKFFPFQSYTIQNIEAPVNYAYNSNLKCHWAIFGNGTTYTVPFELIKTATSGAFFNLTAAGATVRKWYDPTTDRVCFELGGASKIDELTLSVMGETVKSSDYNLPIPANLHIALKSGCALTLAKPMTVHAGAVVEVKNGATLNVNAKVYMYDADDWDMYCMYSYYYRTYNNLTLHYNRGTGTSKATLEDATLIVDGTVNIGAQNLYVTAHGANICGNGGGTLKYAALPSNTTMTQCKQLSDAVTVNIRSANMHNDNGTYTKGVASTTFKNVHGRWFTNAKATEKANHTYDFTYIKSGDVYGTGGTNGTVSACWSKDKTGLELQDKWANIQAEGCADWWKGIDDSHLYNWTRNSAWHQYIKTGSTTTGSGEEAVTTDTYVGSDGKMLYKTDCEFVDAGSIDGNCLYPSNKALVNGSLIAVTANTSPDHGYHKSDAASTYYLCFEGCVWHPATKNAENLYTVDGTKYIWYGDKWMAVEYDSGVSLHYSLSATNVKIYYDYVDHAWVLATPVAEVVTSAGTEQVFSIANAITKAKAGGTNVTIRLLKNISGTISYDGTNNCGLDLNGFTLSSSTNNMITVNNASANFIIKDQSAAGTGKVQLSYSANERRYAVCVTKGHVIVNSGTVTAINTKEYVGTATDTKPEAKATTSCVILVKAGQKCTINGGLVEAKATYNPYAIYSDGANSIITVNGGKVRSESTQVSSPYAIISYGTINVNGGEIEAFSKTTSTIAIYVHADTSKQGTLNMTGGTVTATSTTNTVTGILVNRGLAYNSTTAEPRTIKQEYPGVANISGGTIKALTNGSTTAYGFQTYGTLNISGGEVTVKPKTTTAYGVYLYAGTTTISGTAHIDVQATNTAYGAYSGKYQPHAKGGPLYNGTLEMNGGTLDVKTTTGDKSYGVYVGVSSRNVTTTHATDASYFAGNYANAGTATINGGEINVTAKTSTAYALYVEAALSGTFTGNKTPKCTVNGGKFKVVSTDNSTTNVVINNTAATLANFSMAGGYFNIAPNGTTNIAAGKSVKDVDRTKEQAIYDAGYVKKIAGNEYTVTWKDHAGNVIGTSQVESGKVPVWTGGEVNCSDANSTREHNGWSTAAWNGGTSYVFPTALPAIGASDVTYFAHYQTIYADVTTGGVTTRYNSAQGAWTAAMAAKQATIRLLSNLGTEASIGNMTQMVFNPTNANSVIIMDLNGHSWTMGRHATAANNTSPFIHVNPTQTGCKLIITDNSASGNGYLMNSWEKTEGALTCIQISKGELVLQKGALKVKNTASSQYSNGVYVGGANAHFTMTGGTVYSTDGYSPRGVCVGDGYADIAGGTVEANSTASEAYALLSYDTVTVSGGATLRAIGATGSTYGTYCNGAAAVLNIDSAIIISNAYQTSKGIYSLGGGKTTVDGKSSISATTTTGSGAYALYATGANTKITANDGTYTATSALNSAYGVFAENNGAAIVNGGSFTVTATGTNARGVYAQSNGAVTVKGGSLDVTSDTHADPSSFGAYVAGGTVNIEDGNFTLNVHKDLSNRNCDLARCGTGVSYLNISGGTFTGDSAYHAVRSFGGETMITGNPVFTAQRGVDAGAWASADGTAKVTIDGGTFYCTDNFALYATTHTYNGKTVVGDMTVLDGKFHTKSSIKPVYTSSRPIYLKIKGGYFTSYTASDISNNALDSFVVAPSYTTAVESTDPMYASPNDYRYRVNTKFTVTWKDGATTLKTQEYNRNEIPSYGGDYNPSTSAETYEFLGWSPAIGPVTKDTTYTALKQKYEAEVFETGSATTRRYTTFEAAWADVQKIENGTLRILSNCYKGTTLTYNPAPAEGVAEGTPGYFTTATTTIDLNGHTYNNHASTTDTYALEMKKAGCKLIITDTSGKTSGYFGHMNYNAPNCRYRGIKLEQGELVLAGGTLRAQNTYPYLADDSEDFSSSGAYTVLVYAGTTFTMTGGTLLAEAHKNARAVCFVGNGVANISGGEIKVLAQYKKKDDATQYYGAGAYGVIADNSGGTANISGTVTITSKAYSSAIGVYVNASTNAAEANISGGSIDCWAKTQASMPVYCYQTKAVTNISGGSFKANCSQDASAWNTETVSVHKGATVNISGGTYESTTGSNCNAVRNFGGTVTITGNPLFKTRQGVNAGDYAEATQTATIYVNGGTFNTKGYCFYANTNTRESYTVTGKVYVNAGYFNSYGGSICSGTAGTNLVLNGGYYKERSGTSTKTNITTYKGATTTVSTLSPAITVADTTYHYQLLTDFNITWLGGESYSKVTQVKSGVVPTNTDLDGKCFLRNDSAFYFTGWTPTPIGVIGDATYNAAGVYHEAKVTVSAQDSIFDNFDEAWAYAMDQASATITLLTNLTRTTSIIYNPTPANARHTFDLNNFTIKENTTDRLLIVNKTGAHLTITDNSSAKGGCLYKKMESSTNVYTTVVYHGELILAGGKLYVENTKDDKGWHPAECVHVSRSTDGIFTMTGGTVESQAKYLAYPLYNYATTNISGGTIIANATTQGAAQGLYAVAGTATISGGTWNISSTTSGAVGAAATGWVNTTGTPRENGVLNITGGTFNVSAAISNVQGIKSYATGKRIDGTNYSAHGIVNVSGGTFNVTCSAATATQVFAAHVDAWRLFDNALPHTLLAEARGEMNISGGTFTVDARNNGAWVANSGNVDLLRNWGILNVSGGNFTIHQYRTPSAISVFRGKATVTGNPVFNVYAHTGNAYAVCAGYWTHESYCDKNAANNLAEAEVNGGTYNIITEGQNTNVIYSLGQISAESRDAVADTITAHAGYAMNAKVTVNGGTFLGICPNESGKYPIMLNSRVDQVGTYGTAKSEIYVNGGKFKSRKGTSYETSTTTGAVNCHNNVGTLLLTGGYYETNGQLAAQKADTCEIIEITSAEVDPEYNNGYRYMIKTHYVARVTATGVDRKFTTFRGAFDYAKTIANSKITLLDNINYTGLNFVYNPATATSCTLDLNGYTFKGAISGHTGDVAYNNDRLLVINKAGATFTIKDSSVGKTGKWIHEKGDAGFAVIVYHGTCVMESGTVHCKNTSGGSAQALRSENYSDAFITMTGGKAHAETAGTAYGLNAYNKVTISGGEILAESSAGAAYGVFNNEAIDTTIISGGKIKASGTNSYGVLARAVTTISGGKILSECTSADGTAFGVKTEQNATTINGVDSIYAHAARYTYGVHSQGSTAVVTINGANDITAHNVNSENNGSSITTYVYGGGTMNINNGTFYAKCDRAYSSNVHTTKTAQNGTMNISGGTFHAEGFQAVSIRGGMTTINGGTFTATTGIRAMDWADADVITGICVVNGGTFTTTGATIHVSSKNNNSRNAHSEVTINGGKFKSTGSQIVQMDDTPSGADPSTLIIAGGYFNEKSGTTFKDQIATYVADTSEINTLDPLYEGIYKYEVAPHYVAKVKTGSTTTYHTTAKRALDYAKTVANPTITLLDNCTLTEANYMINPGNWTGTLDLNNFTLTPTIHAENGRAFTIGGTGTKFIVTDNSVGQGGQIYYKGNSSVSIIYFVVAGGEMELAGGTLYVENTNASKKAIGFVVDGNPSQFTQSAGTFTIKGAYGANGYYGKGTATFTGGTMNVDGGAYQAIGLYPYESTSKLNVSGTFALNVTSSFADSYGVLVKNAGATGTISGGKFNFNQNTMVGAQLDGILTITGGYFNEKSGTTYKTQIAGFVPDTCNLNTLDPLYESKYKYQVVVHHVAKVVETGGAETYFTLVTSALDFFKTKNNATLTMLDNAELPASPSRYTLIPTISNWRGTWDLNDKTVYCTSSTYGYAMFDLNKSDAILTITDNSIAKRGRLEHVESSASGAVWGLNIENGEIILEAGTIYAKNPNADATGSKYGISVKNANSRFTMNGGRIECVGSTNTQGLNLSGGSTATVSGGKIISIAELNGTVGNYAYGIYISGTSTLTVNGADSIYAKGGKDDNTRAYALNAGGGMVTIEGTPFIMAESPTKGARALQSAGSASVTVNGGVFEAKAGTTDSYALIAEGTSTMTVNGGKYKTNQTNITYKSANATLTINGGYYNESSGTNHKTRVANYLGSGKVILNLDAADAEYAAGYRYVVTSDPVAKVTAGSEVTYYTALNDAFNYAKTQNNAEVTLLKDVVSTSTYTWSPSLAISNTFDLNGHSLSSTTGTVLGVGKAGATLTIKDTPGGGSISYSSTTGGWNPTVHVGNGKLVLQGGTISRATDDGVALGVQVYTTGDATPEFEMTGGKIQTSGVTDAYAVLTKSTGSNYAETTISGGEVSATATGTYAFALTAAQKGNITVKGTNNPKISATDATTGTQVARNEGGGATFTIEGGLFKASRNASPFSGTVSISGGYFNEYGSTTTYKTQIESRCVAPKHAIALTAAEQAALGEGGTDYKYKVVDAYTLTWTTDGDPLTGEYTSGYTEPGATITAPNTPTKTGYTFAGWSTTPAATMPASDVTYTATWTINSFDVTFNMQGHGAAIAKQTIDYNGLVTEPATPTEANYVFGGWYKEAGCTNAWNFASDHVTAATTLYAKWIAAEAEVSFNGGAATPYTTLAEAFTAAKGGNKALIKVLKDVPGLSTALTYNPSSTYSCTLDLNGYTISGTVTGLLTIYKSGSQFTITDNSGANPTGQIRLVSSGNANRYCVYLRSGKLTLEKGTIYAENTSTTDAGTSIGATAVYVNNSSSYIFTMNNGSLEAKANYRAHGVYSYGKTDIKGGTIKATIAEGGTSNAYGVYSAANKTTITGSPTITVEAPTAAYGAFAAGNSPDSKTGAATHGTVDIQGGTFNVTATAGAACAVNANAGRRKISSVADGYATGNYVSHGKVFVSDGTFNVSGTSTVYGVNVTVATYGAFTDANGVSHPAATAYGYAEISGGKFILTTGTTYAANETAPVDSLIITGGYFSTSKTSASKVLGSKYIYSGNASSLYRVFDLTAAQCTAAGMPANSCKVARFYTITYNKGANGTGTIAAEYKAHGDDFTLSSSTFTRTGYTQTGWSTSDGGAKVYELGGTYSDNADLTVYPFWSANNYTVTLNNQSATTAGTTSITVTYNSNTNLTATPAITVPTKTGYTFGGYYVDQGGSGKQVIAANGNVNASVSGITDASKNWIASTGGTIYAKWTQTVTLHDNNGGIHNGSLEVTYNSTYKSGTPPTREGYTAEGYYAEPACTNKVLTTAAVWVNYSGWVEGGKWVHDGESTLYTKWIEDTHTVTVAAGANGSASPASVTAGITTASGTITATPNTGYHFTNWTLVSGVTAASTYSTTSNPIRINATADGKTITANFAANTNTAYTVKHYKQNLAGDGYDLADTDNLTGTTGASVTPAVKSYEGFTAPSTQTETIAADGSLVIEYQYTRNSYTLTWALDGGSISVAGTTAGSVKYGASLTAPTVTKTGYTFAGWSPDVPATMPASDATYTATWTADTYTVTLDRNSGTSGATSVTMTYNSSTMTGYSKPGRTGYTFGGYYTSESSNNGTGDQVINKDGVLQANVDGYTGAGGVWIRTTATTLYAKWSQNRYYITFTHNGNGTISYNGTTIAAGGTARVYQVSKKALVATPNTGYYFTGWTVTGSNAGKVTIADLSAATTTIVATGGTAATVTVTAGFAPNTNTAYTVKHYKQKLDGTYDATPDDIDELTGTTGASVTPAVKSYTGFTAPSTQTETIAADGSMVIEYQYTRNSYTLTWNLDGGSISVAGTPAGSVKYGASLTAPTVEKAGYTFADWTPEVAATMPAEATTYTATWTPVALLRFTGATNSQWGNSSNWDPACVPTAAHDVYILKPCSVDIEHAAAKSIVLDQSDSHSGSLTVGANKGLEVVGTITRTTTGEDKLATRPEDLKLETSTIGNASLIFNNSNSNQATVDLYSKGYIDGSGTKNYQYIGVPVNEASALYNFYGSWMYSWGIKKNGSWGWVSVKNGALVYEWTGYCITQQEPTYYAIEGTLVPTTTKDITVPADENMVVGNSWTAPIDINAMTPSDLEGLAANIYFFNTGVDKEGSAGAAGSRYVGGTYVTIPVEAAKYTGEDDHINSMQGFFVKNTNPSAEGTLHLDYDKHVRGTTRGSIIGDELHAPKRAQADSDEPVVLKIKVSGENYDDKLILLGREDFTAGFDNGWDGDKWDGNESALYLYTTDSEGTENSVSAVPELEGTVIGFRAGEDDGYTLYFDYLNSDETLYLYDTETHTYTRIETGATYWFMTYDKEKHERFIITRSDEQQITTGVGNVEGNDGQGAKARKLIIEDKMFIMVDGKLFDATGKIVK